MSNLSPFYSARKSSNHKLSQNHKILTQIYIKENIHKLRTQNFRRISPFGITPVKKASSSVVFFFFYQSSVSTQRLAPLRPVVPFLRTTQMPTPFGENNVNWVFRLGLMFLLTFSYTYQVVLGSVTVFFVFTFLFTGGCYWLRCSSLLPFGILALSAGSDILLLRCSSLLPFGILALSAGSDILLLRCSFPFPPEFNIVNVCFYGSDFCDQRIKRPAQFP